MPHRDRLSFARRLSGRRCDRWRGRRSVVVFCFGGDDDGAFLNSVLGILEIDGAHYGLFSSI